MVTQSSRTVGTTPKQLEWEHGDRATPMVTVTPETQELVHRQESAAMGGYSGHDHIALAIRSGTTTLSSHLCLLKVI
jgi:hypothetical protein